MQTFTRYSFKRSLPAILWALTLTWTHSAVGDSTSTDVHETEEHHYKQAHVNLTAGQIARGGIAIKQAAPAPIRETLPLYGQVVPNAEREYTVTARFPGVIQRVDKRIGDSVKQGETLFMVESNESLKPYAVTASLSGIVSQRNANAGEQTGDRALFVIGDYATVWVNLSVFPRELSRVHVGQMVIISNSDSADAGEGKVIAVSPVGSSTNQSTTARVLLDNSDRRWVPGHFVSAEVVLAEREVPVAIDSAAIQTLDDQSVVFVAGDEGFEARPVTLGRHDGQFSEVLEGLAAGEPYVAANSFIIKSEFGKGSADHGH